MDLDGIVDGGPGDVDGLGDGQLFNIGFLTRAMTF